MKNHANMAAAQSTPTTLAVARLRRRKRASGIRGALTRDSMTRNRTSNATPAPRNPSVRPDDQPTALPLTIAYTTSMSDAVTVTAPATSSRPVAFMRAPGSSLSDSATTATPIGRLTRKIQCQSSESVRTPPSKTPIAPPPEATKPKMPIALARSAGSTNRFIVSDRETADAIAPPTPCTARAVTRNPCEPERPQPSEARVKSVMPMRNRRRWP